MSYEIRPDYTQRFLLPPDLEDWVGSDHPARFIRDFVEALDLEELGFSVRLSEEGRPNYSSDLLVKVWVYAYYTGVRSTRKLEKACCENVALIWLTGMNYPDHNTLWRFFRRYRKELKGIWKKSAKVAFAAGLVGLLLHAVDGTKIVSRSSKKGAWHRKDLEELLEKIESSIEEMTKEVEVKESLEEMDFRLPDKLEEKQSRVNKIKEALQRLDDEELNHMHPDDPDARMMKVGNRIEFAYNAQVVVDEENGLILAQDVTTDASDNNQLVKMISEVEENLGEVAEETVADGGYYSGKQLLEAESRNYGVMVNLGKQRLPDEEFHISEFRYDEERDVCVCPKGKELKFEREKSNKRKEYTVRVYRCKVWRDCPFHAQCSKDKRGRSIEITPYHQAVFRQQEKHRDKDKKELLYRRKAIVESVFGHIKWNMGFRRSSFQDMINVGGQWSLICTAHNLKKLYKYWVSGNLDLKLLSN